MIKICDNIFRCEGWNAGSYIIAAVQNGVFVFTFVVTILDAKPCYIGSRYNGIGQKYICLFNAKPEPNLVFSVLVDVLPPLVVGHQQVHVQC